MLLLRYKNIPRAGTPGLLRGAMPGRSFHFTVSAQEASKVITNYLPLIYKKQEVSQNFRKYWTSPKSSKSWKILTLICRVPWPLGTLLKLQGQGTVYLWLQSLPCPEVCWNNLVTLPFTFATSHLDGLNIFKWNNIINLRNSRSIWSVKWLFRHKIKMWNCFRREVVFANKHDCLLRVAEDLTLR